MRNTNYLAYNYFSDHIPLYDLTHLVDRQRERERETLEAINLIISKIAQTFSSVFQVPEIWLFFSFSLVEIYAIDHIMPILMSYFLDGCCQIMKNY